MWVSQWDESSLWILKGSDIESFSSRLYIYCYIKLLISHLFCIYWGKELSASSNLTSLLRFIVSCIFLHCCSTKLFQSNFTLIFLKTINVNIFFHIFHYKQHKPDHNSGIFFLPPHPPFQSKSNILFCVIFLDKKYNHYFIIR